MQESMRVRARPAEATMRDVAALAAVSVKTVSRVLNEEAGAGPAVVARVRAAAEALAYRPNLSASALRRNDRRSATLGVLLEDLSNPFDAALLRAVEARASDSGVLVLAGSDEADPSRQARLLESLARRRVDAMVVMPPEGHQDVLRRERDRGMPMVLVDRPPTFGHTDSVTTDNRESTRAAVLQLAALGHRSIAFLGHRPALWTSSERRDGYAEGLGIAGLVLDDTVVLADLQTSGTGPALSRLLDRADPPTAVLAAQNQLTVEAVRVLRARGQSHEVALVGFDDFPLAELLEPAVTVVAQDIPRIGRTAADMLFQRIDGDASPAEHAVVPATLVRRGSGELPPPASPA